MVTRTVIDPPSRRHRPRRTGRVFYGPDKALLRFIGEEGAVPFSLFRLLLTRFRKQDGVIESRQKTNEAKLRLQALGLIQVEPLDTDELWVRLTRQGMEQAELPYEALVPKGLPHRKAVAWVRFDLEDQYRDRLRWVCLRDIYRQLPQEPHYPDGWVYIDGNLDPIAIHVERTLKKPRTYRALLPYFGEHYGSNWYFTTPKITSTVSKHIHELYPDEESCPFAVYSLEGVMQEWMRKLKERDKA
jgi:hypothetical protein